MKLFWIVCWLGGAGLAQADEIFVQEVKKLAATGMPYVYGAEDPQRGGLDCSGFVMVAAHRAWGVDLPNEAGLQLEYIRQQHGKVWDAQSRDWFPQMLKPGDLIFWSGTRPSHRPSPVTHVMVYVGEGLMAGAQSRGHRVQAAGSGVGFYPFRSMYPQGNPMIVDDSPYRHRMTLYAYGRLDPAPTVPMVSKVSIQN